MYHNNWYYAGDKRAGRDVPYSVTNGPEARTKKDNPSLISAGNSFTEGTGRNMFCRMSVIPGERGSAGQQRSRGYGMRK